jgi:hypothetical protein
MWQAIAYTIKVWFKGVFLLSLLLVLYAAFEDDINFVWEIAGAIVVVTLGGMFITIPAAALFALGAYVVFDAVEYVYNQKIILMVLLFIFALAYYSLFGRADDRPIQMLLLGCIVTSGLAILTTKTPDEKLIINAKPPILQ